MLDALGIVRKFHKTNIKRKSLILLMNTGAANGLTFPPAIYVAYNEEGKKAVCLQFLSPGNFIDFEHKRSENLAFGQRATS